MADEDKGGPHEDYRDNGHRGAGNDNRRALDRHIVEKPVTREQHPKRHPDHDPHSGRPMPHNNPPSQSPNAGRGQHPPRDR
jgi:hypothetical protein